MNHPRHPTSPAAPSRQATPRRLRRAAAVLAALAFALAPAAAGAGIESDWSATGSGAVRLLAGARSGDQLDGGVEIRLAPGWKTYWRYPGDSGVPPQFDWSGSENLAGVDILWPAPHRFDDGDGAYSIGYKHDVILPFHATPKDPTRPVSLRLKLDFAVCEKICQPAHAEAALDIPATGAAPSPPELLAALAAVPQHGELGGAGPTALESARLVEVDGAAAVRIEARVADPAKADLFVEGPDEAWALPLPQARPAADGRVVFLMPLEGMPKGADLTATGLRFTLVDGDRAIELTAPVSAP
ncbi:hypothetical protein KHC27_21350 [Ancylobacter lacus]|nr:hypothetical protein [Ancylobacter lacus]